jgi:hypothetical protein
VAREPGGSRPRADLPAGQGRSCGAPGQRSADELQDQDAGVAAVEAADAIAASLDLQEGPGAAVDHDGVAEEFRVPDGRDIAARNIGSAEAVEELTGTRVEQRRVGVERPVLNRDGDLIVLGAG